MESQKTKITSESVKKCSGDLMCAALLMNLIGSAMEHGLGVINTSGTQDDFSAQIKKPDSTYRVSVCITNVWECWPDKVFVYPMKSDHDFTGDPVRVTWDRVMDMAMSLLNKME